MDSEQAAAYLGIPTKTLKTKDWRDGNDIPYGYIGGRLLFDRLALDQRFASCSGNPGGTLRPRNRGPFNELTKQY
jgi:helix-turn-helix protein